MMPTIGQIVQYKLSADDALAINKLLVSGTATASRVGNAVAMGQVFPAIVVKVLPPLPPPVLAPAPEPVVTPPGGKPALLLFLTVPPPSPPVQLQVFLDGNDVLWAQGITEGTLPGTYAWPQMTKVTMSAVGAGGAGGHGGSYNVVSTERLPEPRGTIPVSGTVSGELHTD